VCQKQLKLAQTYESYGRQHHCYLLRTHCTAVSQYVKYLYITCVVLLQVRLVSSDHELSCHTSSKLDVS